MRGLKRDLLSSVRWQHFYILLVCLGLLLLQACKTTVLLAEGDVPLNEMIVREHICSNNINALMVDLHNCPNCQSEVLASIMDGDVSQLSDNQLSTYLNCAVNVDSVLWNYYNVEKTYREITALKCKFAGDLASVVNYCNINESRYPFLSSFISEVIEANVSNMSYLEQKNAYDIFRGGQIGNILHGEIDTYKRNNKQEIQHQLDSYFEAERMLINYYEYAIRLLVYIKVYDCFPKMMMAVFDGNMPESYSACDKRVQGAITGNFRQNEIDFSVRKLLDEAVCTINENRQQLLSALSISGTSEKATSISLRNVSLPTMGFSYNMSPIYEISKIDNEKKGIGKTILGVFFPVIGFVSGAIDASDQGEREKPYVEQFVSDFGKKLVPACDKYINHAVSQLRRVITNSQQQFVKEYYYAY